MNLGTEVFFPGSTRVQRNVPPEMHAQGAPGAAALRLEPTRETDAEPIEVSDYELA